MGVGRGLRDREMMKTGCQIVGETSFASQILDGDGGLRASVWRMQAETS